MEKGTAGVIAFSIASLAYVPHARVLARTYARHNEGESIWVLLIDDVEKNVCDQDEPFHVLRLDDIDLDETEIHRMAMLFGDKLIAAIKPWIFQHFLSGGADTVLYIDSDFMIFDSLEEMCGTGDDGVILVPHVLSPLPRDGMDPDETTLLGAGMYNAGLFGVGPRHGGFLEFLMERLSRECVFDAKKMRFNEQRWLDFVPSLFPYRIVRDPGVDVAYWNLHERPLSRRGDQWLVGERPLRAFHFSSFDPRATTAAGRFELATAAPRVRISTDPLLAELCDEYRRMVYAEGLTDNQEPPFAFDLLPDGTPVYDSSRHLFREAVLAADVGDGDYPPDPFDPSARDAFRSWAVERYAAAGRSLPRRMSVAPTPRTNGSATRARWLRTRRRHLGARRHETPGTPASVGNWAMDLLDRMIVDEAGKKDTSGIEIVPQRSGFVCHGPRAPLVPGPYRVTLEFDAGAHVVGAAPEEQALVVEAFVQGYAVGSCTASFADIAAGAIVLDIAIPEHLRDVSLLLGVELRILTRGRLRATLSAIVLEPGEVDREVRGSESADNDWLPVMAGGNAGLRVGGEVVTIAGATGVVVAGPNWRLVPGGYRATIRTRVEGCTEQSESAKLQDSVVAVVEVGVGDKMLMETSLTLGDLARGAAELDFVIGDDNAHPDAQVGVRVVTVVPIDAAVTSVQVDRFPQLPVVDGSVA